MKKLRANAGLKQVAIDMLHRVADLVEESLAYGQAARRLSESGRLEAADYARRNADRLMNEGLSLGEYAKHVARHAGISAEEGRKIHNERLAKMTKLRKEREEIR